MIERAERALCKAYVKTNYELQKLMREEDGDGEVSKVVYIAIAVIGALIIMGLLFGENHDGQGGLIHEIWEGIEEKIHDIFN